MSKKELFHCMEMDSALTSYNCEHPRQCLSSLLSNDGSSTTWSGAIIQNECILISSLGHFLKVLSHGPLVLLSVLRLNRPVVISLSRTTVITFNIILKVSVMSPLSAGHTQPGMRKHSLKLSCDQEGDGID